MWIDLAVDVVAAFAAYPASFDYSDVAGLTVFDPGADAARKQTPEYLVARRKQPHYVASLAIPRRVDVAPRTSLQRSNASYYEANKERIKAARRTRDAKKKAKAA